MQFQWNKVKKSLDNPDFCVLPYQMVVYSESELLLQIRKEVSIMLRKALTLGMVFILALSLLAASMVTCFTYDAEAHLKNCKVVEIRVEGNRVIITLECEWHTH